MLRRGHLFRGDICALRWVLGLSRELLQLSATVPSPGGGGGEARGHCRAKGWAVLQNTE